MSELIGFLAGLAFGFVASFIFVLQVWIFFGWWWRSFNPWKVIAVVSVLYIAVMLAVIVWSTTIDPVGTMTINDWIGVIGMGCGLAIAAVLHWNGRSRDWWNRVIRR